MVEGGASGTSDDGGIDADWDFHENVTGDSGSGSNGEGGEHGLIDGGEADSEDVPGIDEEEGGGDEAKNVYDRKHRSNDTYKGLEKGRDKELEAEKSRRENKENMNAWPEENEDEDYDDEGENDGEDGEYDEEEENGGEDGDYDDEGEINGDGDDVYDHIEDEEHQKEQHTYQAKEEKRVSREEGIGGTKGNRTESTSEDDDDGGDESEDFNLHTYHPTPGQDIYGRPVDRGNVGTAPAKYVPPHLRASTGRSEVADSDKCQQVQVREDYISLRNTHEDGAMHDVLRLQHHERLF